MKEALSDSGSGILGEGGLVGFKGVLEGVAEGEVEGGVALGVLGVLGDAGVLEGVLEGVVEGAYGCVEGTAGLV